MPFHERIGVVTDIPRLYFHDSRLSEQRSPDKGAVTVPTDPLNQMSELRRNFETSSMPLPHEEPHSYLTESDDARLSSINFKGAIDGGVSFSEREGSMVVADEGEREITQEDNSRIDLQAEWKRYQERGRQSSRFHFQRKKLREASGLSSFS